MFFAGPVLAQFGQTQDVLNNSGLAQDLMKNNSNYSVPNLNKIITAHKEYCPMSGNKINLLPGDYVFERENLVKQLSSSKLAQLSWSNIPVTNTPFSRIGKRCPFGEMAIIDKSKERFCSGKDRAF